LKASVMGNDRTAVAAALAVALSLAAAALPARGADAPPCDDCKFLPCVESELRHYKEAQRIFNELAASAQGMDMDTFKKTSDEKIDQSLASHEARIKDKDACKTRWPEGLIDGEMTARKRWQGLGFGVKDMGDGKIAFSWSAVTDPTSCKLRESQIEAIRELVSCVDLAVATEKHERKHVADCDPKKAATAQAQARYEAAGYAEGIKELEKTMRRLKNKRCPRPQPSHQGPKAHEQMQKTLGAAKDRLSMYAKSKGL